jgi:hypothetical protein
VAPVIESQRRLLRRSDDAIVEAAEEIAEEAPQETSGDAAPEGHLWRPSSGLASPWRSAC